MLRYLFCLFFTALISTPVLAQTKTSTGSGNWNTAGTWSPNGVPTLTDNVLINNGHLISFNTNGSCNSLTVGTGSGANAVFEYSGGTARTLSVQTLLQVNSNGFVQVLNTSNTTHSLSLNGDLVNNGSFDMNRDGNSRCRLVFRRNGNQTVSGTGSVNDFYQLVINMGNSNTNVVDFALNAFTVPTGFLTLLNGTMKVSTVSGTTLVPYTVASTIPSNGGIWLNSATAVMSTSNDITLSGLLRITNGVFNVGNANNEDLIASSGTLEITGGELNVAGKLSASTSPIQYTQSGGILRVNTVQSNNTTISPFHISSSGSGFNVSGGRIEIVREGGTGAQNLGFVNTGSSSGSVTGGTLQIGNAATPASQIFLLNSTFPVPSLVLNSANATAQLSTNSLQVNGDVVLNSGILNDNSLILALNGNWNNTGGTFSITGGTTLFNSSASTQAIFKNSGETFNHLNFTGAGQKNFASPLSARNFSIQSGSTVDVSSSNHVLTLSGNFINNGNFISRAGALTFSGTSMQNISGSSITDFYDLNLNNTVGLQLSNSENLLNKLSISNGTFNTNGQIFTLVSNVLGSARIGQISGTGNLAGNFTIQRFAPGGSTGWAFIGTPISSGLSLQDWDDDIFISCPTCPDGSAAGFLSVYTYNEAASGSVDDPASYIALNGITDPLISDKGYWVYLGNAQSSTGDITLDVSGTVRKFNQSIPLGYTNFGSSVNDGWNLIHNPFPSPISWTAFRGSTANLDNAYYVYNADLNGGTGGYASFVNGVSSPATASGGIDDNIPMSQGFYVHCTAATTISAGETVKVDANPSFLKSQNSASVNNQVPTLRLQLSDSLLKDECVLYYNAGSTSSYNTAFDALKLPGTDVTAPNLALISDSLNFQIKGIAPVNGTYTLELLVKTGQSGLYKLEAKEFQSLPSGLCIRLFDRFTNNQYDLKSGPAQFWLYDSTTLARFVILLERHSLNITSSYLFPTCLSPDGGKIWATPVSPGPWDFIWKDSNGQVLQQHLNSYLTDSLKHLSGGYYSLEVSSPSGCMDNTSAYTLPEIKIPVAQFILADSILAGSFVQTSNLSQNAMLFNWDMGDGSSFYNLFEPGHFYLKAGTYQVTLFAESQSACIDSLSHSVVVYGGASSIQELRVNQKPVLQNSGNKTFKIEFQNNQDPIQIQIFDASGRMVSKDGFYPVEGRINLNLENLTNGIYYLNYVTTEYSGVLKLPLY